MTQATAAAGADVEGVGFSLSRETRNELKRTAIDRAMRNANAKAETIAERGNMAVVGVNSVSTDRLDVPRFGLRLSYTDAATAADAQRRVETKIQTNAKTVSATVSVTYSATEGSGL